MSFYDVDVTVTRPCSCVNLTNKYVDLSLCHIGKRRSSALSPIHFCGYVPTPRM